MMIQFNITQYPMECIKTSWQNGMPPPDGESKDDKDTLKQCGEPDCGNLKDTNCNNGVCALHCDAIGTPDSCGSTRHNKRGSKPVRPVICTSDFCKLNCSQTCKKQLCRMHCPGTGPFVDCGSNKHNSYEALQCLSKLERYF
jgi:hypothetical protein